MPLVFVHGVNVRNDADYSKHVEARNSLFRRFALSAISPHPQEVAILNSYWGQYGVKFAWDQSSLPKRGIEELGPEDELPIILLSQVALEEQPDPNIVLLQVAKRSLEEAVDLLWAISLDQVNALQADALAELAVRASEYVKHNPHPAWLDTVSNDEQFLRDLEQAIDHWQAQNVLNSDAETQNWESLGFNEVWEQVKEGASRIKSAVSRLAGRAAVDVARPELHQHAARFIGDVLTYVNQRGTCDRPGAIVTEVAQTLEQARAQLCSEDEKLIVVAHSMGGNITYDILTHFRPDIQVDVFVTVGSQVALFEEMKLFSVSDQAFPVNPQTDRLSLPTNIGHWINIFDYNDVFGFAAEGVFTGVKDFSYSTGRGVISAHTTYFTRTSLHRRLCERLCEAFGMPPANDSDF